MSEIFYSILVNSFFVSFAIILAMALGAVFDKKVSARVRCMVWLAISALLLVPFRPDIELPDAYYRLPLPETIAAGEMRTQIVRLADMPFEPNNIDTQQVNNASPRGGGGYIPPAITEIPIVRVLPQTNITPDLNPGDLYFLVWLAVALGFIALRGFRLARFTRQTRRWSRPPGKTEADILSKTAEEMGIKKYPRLAICPVVQTPMLLGMFRPVILLPEQKFENSGLLLSIKHELTHWRRKDCILGFIVNLAVAVNWFNPLVHLMAKHMASDVELACDEEVTRFFNTDEKKKYSLLLIGAINGMGKTTPGFPYKVLAARQQFFNKRSQAI